MSENKWYHNCVNHELHHLKNVSVFKWNDSSEPDENSKEILMEN
jgi:hypothetical protein